MATPALTDDLSSAGLVRPQDYEYETVGPNSIVFLKRPEAVRTFAAYKSSEPLKVRRNCYRTGTGRLIVYTFVGLHEPRIDPDAAAQLVERGDLVMIGFLNAVQQDYTWRDSPPPRFADSSPM